MSHSSSALQSYLDEIETVVSSIKNNEKQRKCFFKDLKASIKKIRVEMINNESDDESSDDEDIEVMDVDSAADSAADSDEDAADTDISSGTSSDSEVDDRPLLTPTQASKDKSSPNPKTGDDKQLVNLHAKFNRNLKLAAGEFAKDIDSYEGEFSTLLTEMVKEPKDGDVSVKNIANHLKICKETLAEIRTVSAKINHGKEPSKRSVTADLERMRKYNAFTTHFETMTKNVAVNDIKADFNVKMKKAYKKVKKILDSKDAVAIASISKKHMNLYNKQVAKGV